MARSLDQILAEVSAQSDPQKQIVLSQIAGMPSQQAADESGLAAKKDQAYEDIVSGARRRGMGFSGIPLGEQAQYNATDYMPALANLRTSYGNRKSILESALADIGKSDYVTANDIYDKERSFEEQQRQSAATSATLGSLFGGDTPDTSGAATSNFTQRADKGFNFVNQYGNSISAAQYAAETGTPFRDLLGMMARAGDKGAAAALAFVGNDYGYDPNKIGGNSALYNALVWGTGKQYSAKKSAAKKRVTPERIPGSTSSSVASQFLLGAKK
jgi:hypothetical protein